MDLENQKAGTSNSDINPFASNLMCGVAKELSKKELKQYKRQCWGYKNTLSCKGFALFVDWAGWKWCLRCFISHHWFTEHAWIKLKYAKINWKAIL